MKNQYKTNFKIFKNNFTIYPLGDTPEEAIDTAIMHLIDNIKLDHIILDPKVHGKSDVIRISTEERFKFMVFLKEKIKEYKYGKFYPPAKEE